MKRLFFSGLKMAIIALCLYALPTQAQTLNQHQIISRQQVAHKLNAFYDLANDIIVLQAKGLVRNNIPINLLDEQKKVLQSNYIYQGSTIAFFYVQMLYEGKYYLEVFDGNTEPQLIEVLINRQTTTPAK
jgi:hypothetical protein